MPTVNETPRFLVYGLIDPRTNELRYVGKSSSGMRRPKFHQTAAGRAGRTYNTTWLRQMWADGVVPSIMVLRICDSDSHALAVEREVIALFRACEFSLTNLTDGGEGTCGCIPSVETRKKQSEARRGKHPTPEAIAKTTAANTGRRRTAEMCLNISKAKKGKPLSLDHRAKLSLAHMGKKPSVEAIAKTAAAHRGKPLSAEHREKIAAAQRGKPRAPISAAQRAKISVALRGIPKSPEHVANLRKAWALRKERSRSQLTSS